MFFQKDTIDYKNQKAQIIKLIDQGLGYEENFIATYSDLLLTEDISGYYDGDNLNKVKDVLQLLIRDSQRHKKALEQVKQEIETYDQS
jgi:hypothetical protein